MRFATAEATGRLLRGVNRAVDEWLDGATVQGVVLGNLDAVNRSGVATPVPQFAEALDRDREERRESDKSVRVRKGR